MYHVARGLLFRLLAVVTCLSLAAGCATTAAQGTHARFDREALEAMLAPVALYPDPLLSQVLMASTYPREVDEAAHWSRARPGLSGDAAVRTSEGWDWDPSVRSLLAFPLVLDTMARNMRWTENLGDAFLAQREDVMDAVQHLRRRAHDNGTLRSTEYVRVIDTGREIVIEPYSPQVAHVPHYDPRVVYGSWWWPSRPPMYWARWPGYAEFPGHAHVVHWGPGIGISAGFFFGGIVWPRREVHVVNVNSYYYTRRVVVERPVEIHRQPQLHAAPARDANPGAWRHDASRRRGPESRVAPLARGSNEQPAPLATRPAEQRRDPAPAAPARAMAAPARSPEPAAAEREQRRQAAPATPPQRRADRADRADDPVESPRMARPAEQRPTPAAGNVQAQRRAEPTVQRDEQREKGARNRDDDAPRARGAQDGTRGAQDGARGNSDSPRGMQDSARGASEGARAAQDGARGTDRAGPPGRQPERQPERQSERGRASRGAGS